eukprot:3269702-Rhodomonas_salina.1
MRFLVFEFAVYLTGHCATVSVCTMPVSDLANAAPRSHSALRVNQPPFVLSKPPFRQTPFFGKPPFSTRMRAEPRRPDLMSSTVRRQAGRRRCGRRRRAKTRRRKASSGASSPADPRHVR